MGLVLQLLEAGHGARIIRGEQPRIIAGIGKARLGLRQRLTLRRANEAEHDRRFANGLGKLLIVGGKLVHFGL